jgi:hypothetical protein
MDYRHPGCAGARLQKGSRLEALYVLACGIPAPKPRWGRSKHGHPRPFNLPRSIEAMAVLKS